MHIIRPKIPRMPFALIVAVGLGGSALAQGPAWVVEADGRFTTYLQTFAFGTMPS